MNEEEKKTIDLFIKKIDKCDETITIKDLSVGEEYRMLQTVQKGLCLMEKLQKELNQEKEKNKKLEEGIRQIKDKLEIADYYNCQDGADELTRLLQES